MEPFAKIVNGWNPFPQKDVRFSSEYASGYSLILPRFIKFWNNSLHQAHNYETKTDRCLMYYFLCACALEDNKCDRNKFGKVTDSHVA